jgi:hypothetical protein
MRERFTSEDVDKAAEILGFGMDRDLGVELEDDVEDEFIENSWKEVVKKSWKDLEYGADTQREANEALRIIAEAKGRPKLRQFWQAGRNTMMSPDRAYKLLEIPETVDDNMLITVFSIRVRDTIHNQCLNADPMARRLKSGLLTLTQCARLWALSLNYETASDFVNSSYLVKTVSLVSASLRHPG